MGLWGCRSAASKRYQRRTMVTMSGYLLLVLLSTWEVRHHSPHGWMLYLWAVLPSIPIMITVGLMGRYLQEEKDEYQRLQATQAILVGTAALLGTIVINDFLRSYTPSQGVPPFVSFIIFCGFFGLAQLFQRLRDRRGDGEPSA